MSISAHPSHLPCCATRRSFDTEMPDCSRLVSVEAENVHQTRLGRWYRLKVVRVEQFWLEQMSNSAREFIGKKRQGKYLVSCRLVHTFQGTV